MRAHADALVLVLVHFGPRGVLVLADAGQRRRAISSQVAQVELGVVSVVGDRRRLVAGRQERRAQEARGLGAFQGCSEGLQLQDPQERRQRPALRQPVEDGKVG
jgi:predicted secreted protein